MVAYPSDSSHMESTLMTHPRWLGHYKAQCPTTNVHVGSAHMVLGFFPLLNLFPSTVLAILATDTLHGRVGAGQPHSQGPSVTSSHHGFTCGEGVQCLLHGCTAPSVCWLAWFSPSLFPLGSKQALENMGVGAGNLPGPPSLPPAKKPEPPMANQISKGNRLERMQHVCTFCLLFYCIIF